MMRLVIAGGGTGGHLFPGVAVAREVINEGGEVLFIGTADGIETRVLPREGLTLATVRAGKFMGMGVLDRIRTMAMTVPGIASARRILRGFSPHVVLGVGGYASFPAVVAARLMGLPVAIQEQNAYPGLTNRILAKFADAVALGFKEAESFFPAGRSVFTGNPIRAGLLSADRTAALKAFELAPDMTTILVFGGSGGAHRINAGMIEALPGLSGYKDRVQFIHQSGESDFEEVKAAYLRHGFRANVLPFIYDMAGAYACADIVLCRSGALTLAELAALGKPAVLVPYPHAAHDHQMKNARTAERAGAARVVPDAEADGARLARELTALIDDPEALKAMSLRSLTLDRPGAARDVAGLCQRLAARR